MGDELGEVQNKLIIILDKSMKSIFGDNTADAMYYYLQKRFLLELDDIPERPQAFTNAIKEIFGETGADIIEALLVKDLCERFGIDESNKANTFEDCLDEVKLSLLKAMC